MNIALSEKLANYGRWTYRGAWALEIAAATIGLATGLALGYQAFSAGQSVTAMDLTLASAPFFMVAIAELTKIPIATLLFSVSWIWKPVILSFLLLLAGITFETVFMGLERAGSLRQFQYEQLADRVDVLRREADSLEASDEAALKTDQVEEAFAEIDKAAGAAEREREQIKVAIADIDRQLEGSGALSPAAARARDHIVEIEAERTALLSRRDQEVATAVKQFEDQRDSFVERIKIATEAGNAESVRRSESELARLKNPRPALIAKYDQPLSEVDAKIAGLRAEFNRLRQEGPATDSDQREILVARRTQQEVRLRESEDRARISRDDAQKRLTSAQAAEASQAETIANNQERRNEIAIEIAQLEKERIPLARTDQVRRIASRWYGNKPEEVSEAEAGLMSVIWFGSLALIAALAGPITAMVALALQRIGAPSDNRDGKLKHLIRRVLLHWRWRRTRTLIRPVEVPVDREVEKRIEVPVERVVKEILYVPLLTDDPEALRGALNTEMPAELAELVKVSVKGRKRANKA